MYSQKETPGLFMNLVMGHYMQLVITKFKYIGRFFLAVVYVCTFAPATIAPVVNPKVKHNPNPNPNPTLKGTG